MMGKWKSGGGGGSKAGETDVYRYVEGWAGKILNVTNDAQVDKWVHVFCIRITSFIFNILFTYLYAEHYRGGPPEMV